MGTSQVPLDAIPSIAKGVNFQALRLGAAEGFILSRIDGVTNVRGICSLSTFPETQTREIIATLSVGGVLELRDSKGAPIQLERPADDAGNLDQGIRSRVQQILRAEESGNLYEALFLQRDADLKAIKSAYRTLTLELHPDNFYGQELGSWKEKIDQAFTAMTKAYEQLSDPETRGKIDARLKLFDTPEAKPSGASDAGSSVHARDPEKVKSERRQSALFQAIKEKVVRARALSEEAEKKQMAGDFLGAHAALKLAVSYDPYNESYKRGLKLLDGKVAKIRSTNSFKKALEMIGAHDEEGAIPLLREAVEGDKYNAAARFELARVLFPKWGRLASDGREEILQLAEAAAVLDAEKVEYLLLAARVLEKAGRVEEAKVQYQAVLKLDKRNDMAKKALKELG